jgi:hypothetical protein
MSPADNADAEGTRIAGYVALLEAHTEPCGRDPGAAEEGFGLADSQLKSSDFGVSATGRGKQTSK